MGVKTNIDFFADNDELFSKLREGNPGYDIIVPSDIYVEKMVKAGMLDRIDQDKISNMGNIDKNFLNPIFDPNREYSIPYMWGTIGIGFNKKRVSKTPDSGHTFTILRYTPEMFRFYRKLQTLSPAH